MKHQSNRRNRCRIRWPSSNFHKLVIITILSYLTSSNSTLTIPPPSNAASSQFLSLLHLSNDVEPYQIPTFSLVLYQTPNKLSPQSLEIIRNETNFYLKQSFDTLYNFDDLFLNIVGTSITSDVFLHRSLQEGTHIRMNGTFYYKYESLLDDNQDEEVMNVILENLNDESRNVVLIDGIRSHDDEDLKDVDSVIAFEERKPSFSPTSSPSVSPTTTPTKNTEFTLTPTTLTIQSSNPPSASPTTTPTKNTEFTLTPTTLTIQSSNPPSATAIVVPTKNTGSTFTPTTITIQSSNPPSATAIVVAESLEESIETSNITPYDSGLISTTPTTNNKINNNRNLLIAAFIIFGIAILSLIIIFSIIRVRIHRNHRKNRLVQVNNITPMYNNNQDENDIILNTSSTVSSFLNIENNCNESPPLSFDDLNDGGGSMDEADDVLSCRNSIIFSIKEEVDEEDELQSTGQSSAEIDSLQYYNENNLYTPKASGATLYNNLTIIQDNQEPIVLTPTRNKITSDEFNTSWNEEIPYTWDPTNKSMIEGSVLTSMASNISHISSASLSSSNKSNTSLHRLPSEEAKGAFPKSPTKSIQDNKLLVAVGNTSNNYDGNNSNNPYYKPDDTTRSNSISTFNSNTIHTLDWSLTTSDKTNNTNIPQSREEEEQQFHEKQNRDDTNTDYIQTRKYSADSISRNRKYSTDSSKVFSQKEDSSYSSHHHPTSPYTNSIGGTYIGEYDEYGYRSNDDDEDESFSSKDESRQFINDLVWLEKRISETRAAANHYQEETNMPDLQSPIQEKIKYHDLYAPPGKLNIVIQSTKDGPTIHTVSIDSSLYGLLHVGDLIVAVDNVDTRCMNADEVMDFMMERREFVRKITVLHFDDI